MHRKITAAAALSALGLATLGLAAGCGNDQTATTGSNETPATSTAAATASGSKGRR